MTGPGNNRGITLIELIVVVSIIAILVIALGFSFQGWMGGYRIESETKQMYVDLMNARARAMQNNRAHFVVLTTTSYTTYEDTDPAPNGDGALNTASDTLIRTTALTPGSPITWSDFADTEIEFTVRGVSNDGKTICSNTDLITEDPSPSGADYDCIIISATRINLGRLTTSIPDGGACNAANCVAR